MLSLFELEVGRELKIDTFGEQDLAKRYQLARCDFDLPTI
jgi:hypothetical protein